MLTRGGARQALFFTAILAFVAAGAALAFGQAAVTTTVNGTITSMNGGSLTVTAPNSVQKTVAVGPKTLILARVAAGLSSIAPGDALGVAAKRGSDGSLTATSINIFAPQLWKRVRRGQFPMKSGEIMTNAEVASYTASSGGRTLTMRYGRSSSAILVPDGTEIHRIVAESPGDLKEGERVVVRGALQSDGSVTAAVISVVG